MSARTNLATNPSFEESGENSVAGPVVRTNRAFDPHARNEATGHWFYQTGTAGDVTSTYETGTDTPDGRSGYFRNVINTPSTGGTEGPYYRQDGTESGVAGDVWTFSFYYRSTTTALNPINTVAAFRSGGATVNNQVSSISAVPGEWVRVVITITATGAYDGFQLWVNEGTGGEPQAGEIIDVTQMLAERTDVLRSYFDYDSLIFVDHPLEPFWTWLEPGGTDDAAPSYLVPNGVIPLSGQFVIASVSQFDADDSAPTGIVASSNATQDIGRSQYGVRSRETSLVVTPTGDGGNGSVAYPADGFADSMSQLGLEPGKTYTVSGYITLASPQESTNLHALARTLRVRATTGTSFFATSDPAPNTPGTHRVSVTFTIPEGTTNAILELFCGSDLPTDLVWWDDILIEEGSTLGGYFDGSTQGADIEVNAWTGPQDASTSVQTTAIITAELLTTAPPQPVQVLVSDLPPGLDYQVVGVSPSGWTWMLPGGVGTSDGEQIRLIDNRAPVNVPVAYRLEVGGITVPSDTVTIPWKPTGAKDYVLIQSLDGSVIVPVRDWKDNGLPRTPVVRSTSFGVHGRTRAVVVLADGLEGTTSVQVQLSQAAGEAFNQMALAGGAVCIRTDGKLRDMPPSDLAVVMNYPSTLYAGDNGVSTDRVWDLTLEWIDEPEPDTVPTVWTWGEIDTLLGETMGLTWGEVDTMFADLTWGDVDATDWGSIA